MEVNGHYTFRLRWHRKKPRYPLNRRPSLPQSRSGRFGGEKNRFPLPAFEPRPILHVAQSLYPTGSQVRREHLRIIRSGKGAKEIQHAVGFASDATYAGIVILLPASNWLLIAAGSWACGECKQLFMSHPYDLVA